MQLGSLLSSPFLKTFSENLHENLSSLFFFDESKWTAKLKNSQVQGNMKTFILLAGISIMEDNFFS